MNKRVVGCICKCGAPVWLWQTEMQTEAELEELRGWKREDDWTMMVEHSPHGCGRRIVVSADDLILLEKPCLEAAHTPAGKAALI